MFPPITSVPIALMRVYQGAVTVSPQTIAGFCLPVHQAFYPHLVESGMKGPSGPIYEHRFQAPGLEDHWCSGVGPPTPSTAQTSGWPKASPGGSRT